jgi:hypothetical protein
MAKTNEKTLSEDDVRAQHLAEVNQAAQWAYLLTVLIGGTLLMVVLIAALAGAA